MECRIEAVDPEELERRLDAFAGLLHACVHAGASIGFILPFVHEDAVGFWRRGVLPALRGGRRELLAAIADDAIVGTVQLDWDTPANQPHRAEARKLLVHPGQRRRGIARLLMGSLEARAKALGRSLITLDTRTGDSAEPLYASMGYAVAGTIPDYCLDPNGTALDSTTIMYKPI